MSESLLTNLLQNQNKKSLKLQQVSNLFDKQITQIVQPTIQEQNQDNQQQQEIDLEKLQKEEEQRTVFVGNIHINAKSKDIQKIFKQYGKIEKIWFRSIPVEKSKIGKKAAIMLKQVKYDQQQNQQFFIKKVQRRQSWIKNSKKNIYINLFLNLKKLDYTKTIFIGNLPFQITEEALRNHFIDCGNIQNLRIIRDPYTHNGKGFGYIYFEDILSFKNALLKNGSLLEKRSIRVKKAVPEKKLIKKQKQRDSKNQEYAIQRLKVKEQRQNEQQQFYQNKKRFVKNNNFQKDKNVFNNTNKKFLPIQKKVNIYKILLLIQQKFKKKIFKPKNN
ncbi:RNA binding motif protein 34, putative [Ichthyophthirius multifiliis]|uniref:RNA binding motif protein 34, putative n=1 Tax=Ichthyophthirius multifiliis TaxID=5932 RepID=G0QY78_ICHMU|nr:RNA binding motif protein 34, putative [Ichthyophthirius multifiliis]EGR29817.1 RNA binding motif protein 34, putative [Ichthyophthirius multifiliis]|eukprot:XP_004031053.1 RNA binding motif protein 34, putative [Ichthyophthirius multifiliis]